MILILINFLQSLNLAVKSFLHQLKELRSDAKSVFRSRTDDASAVQYFQVRILAQIILKVLLDANANVLETTYLVHYSW